MVCAGDALRAWVLSALVVHGAVAGNPDAKRLYDDLLSNYNKLVRPVVNTSDVLRVCIKLKLSQLIDVVRQPDSFKVELQITVAFHIVTV
jgi:nicotinic acetylcholine receptor